MSKEIEALEALNYFLEKQDNLEKYGSSGGFNVAEQREKLTIIETALKNYDELTNKHVILYGRTHGHTQALIDTICKNYQEVKITNLEDEKKLKALEIIIKKNVSIHDLKKSKTLNEYNCCREYEEELTKEEYDILKEVL